ncbi:MAG: PEP-CTERM sorting domain-containing protein [Verrucomicrobiaceae bacterium]|nr:PEP-CTERM sorting domain-containing protein [Verrucomicrobiaceae bacterium]
MLLVLVLGAVVAHADWALEWNRAALEASRAAGESAPEASRTMAILHTSMYDAVNGIVGGYTPYAVSGSNLSGASAQAAASQAAYTVLSQMYGSASFQGLYNAQMSTITNGQAKVDGMNWGSNVATSILTMRLGDGAADANAPYTVSSSAPNWQPTPHSDPALHVTAQPTLTGWGNVTSFAVQNAGGIHSTTAPALTSTQYANDYNEVQTLGQAGSLVRTDDQTHIAHFWSSGSAAGTNTSIVQWNSVADSLATAAGLDLATETRLLAALNVAIADTVIATWDAKYDMNFWRPITAIAYGDDDGNPGTTGDIFAGFPGFWNPELDTASSPETGDVAAIASSAREILENYFGNDDTFMIGTDVNNDGVIDEDDATYDRNNDGIINALDAYREFSSLTEAEAEAILSGIYAGNDFRWAVEAGSTTGETVSTEVNANYFLPVTVPEPSSALLVALGLMFGARRKRSV